MTEPNRGPQFPEGPIDTNDLPYLGMIDAAFEAGGVPMPLVIPLERDNAFVAACRDQGIDVPGTAGGFVVGDTGYLLRSDFEPAAEAVKDLFSNARSRAKIYDAYHRGATTDMPAETIEERFSPSAIVADLERRLPDIVKELVEKLPPGLGGHEISEEQVAEVLGSNPDYVTFLSENSEYAQALAGFLVFALNLTDADARKILTAQVLSLGIEPNEEVIGKLSSQDLRARVAYASVLLEYQTEEMPDDMDPPADETAQLHPTLQAASAIITTAVGHFYHR